MKTVLVPLESPGLVERLQADLIAMYKPVNSQELLAIERIVAAQHALRRCSILENSLFATCYEAGEDSASAPKIPIRRGSLRSAPTRCRYAPLTHISVSSPRPSACTVARSKTWNV